MLSLCCGWNASQTCSEGISVLCMAQGYVQVGFSGRASARAGCFPVLSFCVCFKLAWAEAHLLQSTAQKSACPDPCSAVTDCSSATQTHLKTSIPNVRTGNHSLPHHQYSHYLICIFHFSFVNCLMIHPVMHLILLLKAVAGFGDIKQV